MISLLAARVCPFLVSKTCIVLPCMGARQIQMQAPTDWLYSISVCSVQTVGRADLLGGRQQRGSRGRRVCGR